MNRDDLHRTIDPSPEVADRNGPPSLGERVRSLRLKTGGARPRSAWVPWIITAVSLAVAALAFAYGYRRTPTVVTQAEGDTSSGPVTSAQTAAAGGTVVLESRGYVIAAHQFKLSPQTGGEIIWLDPDFKEGELYKKGEILAVVDPQVYIARVRAAEALLTDAEISLENLQGRWFSRRGRAAEIEQARRQVEVAAATLRLQRDQLDFVTNAKQGATEEEKRKMTNETFKAQADLTVADWALSALERRTQTEIGQARARIAKTSYDLAEARKNLENCVIRAPVNGMVLTKNAELGAYVSPLAFGAAGYLCEMADLSDLEIELDVQERDIPRVQAGQPCRIMLEAYQRDTDFANSHPGGYDGVVSRLMPQANRAKGAITVRVKVKLPEGEKPGSYLRPDMGALVAFMKKGE
jgi:HlyD family secretion protein